MNALAILGTLGGMAGCTGLTDPASAARLPFATGPFILFASLIADRPQDCSGSGTFVGVAIVAPITLTQVGDTVVARSTSPADGDVELRMVGRGLFYGSARIGGTARGTMIDRRADSTLGPVTLRFDAGSSSSQATLEGTAFRDSVPNFLGSALGTPTASGALGTGACARAQWGIRRPY